MQKQQIARAKGMQNRQVNFFPGAPELVDKRLGIQLTVKREKQGDGVGHHYRRIGHHAGGGLLGKLCLLLGA